MFARPALALLALASSGSVLAALAAGCGGGQNPDAGWSPELSEEQRAVRTTEVLVGATQAPAPMAMFGVRHDVELAKRSGNRLSSCTCIAAHVGNPTDPEFLWTGEQPDVKSDASVIAVTARGTECAAVPVELLRRPSISAVETEGPNVIVELESLPEGKPLALGAVIPKPLVGGGVYVRPRTKGTPYGQPTTSTLCRVD